MADINEMGTTVNGGIETNEATYGSTSTTGTINGNTTNVEATYGNGSEFKPVENALPVKTGFWSKVKAFLFQEIDWNKEIKVELTPYQQKVEDEINAFLHQEITWSKVKSFLFKEIKF